LGSSPIGTVLGSEVQPILKRRKLMSAYGAGQIVGVLILVLIAVGIARDLARKRSGGDGDG